MKIVIIGGGSAGTTCAFELRKLNKDVEITIIEKGYNLEYSPCALPYVLSGEIKKFKEIFIFKEEDYKKNKIDILLNSKVVEIDNKNKKIIYERQKQNNEINYDKLVLAFGSSCFIPPIKGVEKENYFVLKTIEDAKRISREIKKGETSVVVGAGLIGIELAASLAKKKENVYLIEAKETILSSLLDRDLSKKLKEYLENKNIKIYEKSEVKNILEKKIIVNKEKISFDKLFLCVGVKPNFDLVKDLKLNKGIQTNEYLETSEKNIYACGDCVESIEFNSNEKILSQLGTTAVRQAKLIAKNILGEKERFPRVMNNTVTKIGDLYVGCVGINEERAKEIGIKTISAKYSGNVRAGYYSQKEKITIKIVCDKKGIIIGGQIIGEEEVVGRLDLLALAIKNKNHVKELANLETCYNPASAPIFDPVTVTAEICLKKLNLVK
jgi:NADH oxidase (H2O2-forming)